MTEGLVIPPGAHTTVPLDLLVASSEARPESARPPMFNCQSCGAVNNLPPHEPYPYYAVTKGQAMGVVRGVSVCVILLSEYITDVPLLDPTFCR